MSDATDLKTTIEVRLREKQAELGLDSGANLWPGTAAKVAFDTIVEWFEEARNSDSAPKPQAGPVETIRYLPIETFAEDGYLHEINRRLLHPLGLALEWRGGYDRTAVVRMITNLIESGQSEAGRKAWMAGHLSDVQEVVWEVIQLLRLDRTHLSGVWDYRDDPEGMSYGDDTLSPDKARNVDRLWGERLQARLGSLGYMIQPIEPE